MKASERSHPDIERLDMRALQILRGIIHNEERKLPEDWRDNPLKHKDQLEVISKTQAELNKLGALSKTLKHLERSNEDLSREYLCFLSALLFNGSVSTQRAFEDNFLNTREEIFFFCIKDKIQRSMITIRER